MFATVVAVLTDPMTESIVWGDSSGGVQQSADSWQTFFPAEEPKTIVKLEKVEAEYGEGPYGGGPGDFDASSSGFYGMYPATAGSSAMAPSTTPLHHLQMDETLKRDKEAIYAHPLYPLLVCLFEKCELATSTPREGGSCDVVSSSSFREDVNEFTRTALSQNDRYYVPNRELDTMVRLCSRTRTNLQMLQAIEMLRFHLLELEKVHELCDNFCNRYVNCLKGKMPMDIIGDERASSSQASASPAMPQAASPAVPPMNQPYHHQPQFEPQSVPLPENTTVHHEASSFLCGPAGPSTSSNPSAEHPLALGGAASSTAGPPLQMPPTAVTSPASSSTGQRRDTPLSADTPHNGMATNGSVDSQSEHGDELRSLCGDSADDGRESVASDGTNGQKRKVPKVFSKDAINKFRAWLFSNINHPYPSEEQKKQLANETGLTILQVNNWFINARRRIVQPMIDQSNRSGRQPPNVFKNRRRRNSGSGGGSNGPSPDITSQNGYSPEASVLPMGYPGADLYSMQRPFTTAPMFPAYANPMGFMPMAFNPAPISSWPMDPLALGGIGGAEIKTENQWMPGGLEVKEPHH